LAQSQAPAQHEMNMLDCSCCTDDRSHTCLTQLTGHGFIRNKPNILNRESFKLVWTRSELPCNT